MKRVFLVFLSVLLMIPLLLISACASEVYVFERVPTDVMFLGSDFDFLYQDGIFVYPGQISAGKYDVSFEGAYDGFIVDSIDVSFSEMIFVDDDAFFPGCSFDCTLLVSDVPVPVTFLCCYFSEEEVTFIVLIYSSNGDIIDLFDFSTATFTSVHSTFGSDFFSNCINVVSSGLSTVSNICSVIVNDGFLLLCAGFLFLGGLVGLSGRLMSHD